MKGLNALPGDRLMEWVERAQQQARSGNLPNYIPLLSQADPDRLAVYIITLDGDRLWVGNLTHPFPLMSVIKVFSLLYLLTQLGEPLVFERVGDRASAYPFNSLTQLELDRGFPRNPMINSGAIALADLLPGKDAADRCENLRVWLNQRSGSHLFFDEAMFHSVRSLPNPKNQALVAELARWGYLTDPELALETYQRICSLAGNIIDLAHLGMILVVSSEIPQCVGNIMTRCGLYEISRPFAEKIGFPTKSGVSGAVLSIVPQQGAIACYSPPLDEHGNSIVGLSLIEAIANFLRSS
jgi:glutaminase